MTKPVIDYRVFTTDMVRQQADKIVHAQEYTAHLMYWAAQALDACADEQRQRLQDTMLTPNVSTRDNSK